MQQLYSPPDILGVTITGNIFMGICMVFIILLYMLYVMSSMDIYYSILIKIFHLILKGGSLFLNYTMLPYLNGFMSKVYFEFSIYQ